MKKCNTQDQFCQCYKDSICLFLISKDTKDACKNAVKIKTINILKTDWKNKNLCMQKGLQFETV